ncbi:MAG: WG repeat-containing protein [Bacteroidia bacterium]
MQKSKFILPLAFFSFGVLFVTNLFSQVLIPRYKGGKWGYTDLEANPIIPFKYDGADLFSKYGTAQVKIGDKYGLINRNGEQVLPCEYEVIFRFQHPIAVARKQGKYGYVSPYGDELTQFVYDQAMPFDVGISRVRKGNLWGGISIEGEFIIPLIYQQIKTEVKGIMLVEQSGYWGMLDTLGNTLLPCEYQEIGEKNDAFRLVKQNNHWGLVDEMGAKIVACKYLSIGEFKAGKAKVTNGKGTGYIDLTGKELIPCKYKGFQHFDYEAMLEYFYLEEWKARIPKLKTRYDDFQAVSKLPVLWVKKGTHFGLIDTNFQTLLPFEFDAYEKIENGFIVSKAEGEGWANNYGRLKIPCNQAVVAEVTGGWLRAMHEGKWCIMDTNGTKLSQLVFDEISTYSEIGYFTVRIDDFWGIVNRSGNLVVPCKFDKVNVIHNNSNYFIVNQGKKEGLYHLQEGEIIPCQYDDIDFHEDGLIVARNNQKFGLLSKNGSQLQPLTYDKVVYMNVEENGLRKVFYRVEKSYHHGLCNQNGEEVIPCIYDSPLLYERGYFIAEQARKIGLLNGAGELVLPCKYDKIGTPNKEGYLTIWNNNLTGLVRLGTGEIVPCKYDNITPFRQNNQFIRVKIGSSYGLLDEFGKVILPVRYSQIEDFEDNVIIIQFDQKWQMFFADSQTIDPNKYDEIEPFQSDFFSWVKIDGKRGIVDKKGKKYFTQ